MSAAFSSVHALPFATLLVFTQSLVALSHPSNSRGTDRRQVRYLPLRPRLALLHLAHVQAVGADQVEQSLCLVPSLSLSLSLSASRALSVSRTFALTQSLVALSTRSAVVRGTSLSLSLCLVVQPRILHSAGARG